MSDLEIDAAALQQVRTKVVAMETLLGQCAKQLGDLSADDVGPASLVARVGSFGDDWTRGTKRLGTFAGSLAESLEVAEATFDQVDEDLSGSTGGPR